MPLHCQHIQSYQYHKAQEMYYTKYSTNKQSNVLIIIIIIIIIILYVQHTDTLYTAISTTARLNDMTIQYYHIH